MRILVTGVSGLIGRLLTEKLKNSADELVGIDIAPGNGSYRFYQLDIAAPELADVASQHRIDTIVHLAWILMNSKDKKADRTNILGTENVIATAKKLGAKKLVFSSTCAVHGLQEKLENFYTEESPFDEADDYPYVRDKIWAEKALQAFQAETGIPVCILRPAPILGPNTDNVISRSISHQNPLPMIDSYDPRRQFVHEDDVAEAFCQAIIKQAQGVFHVSSDAPVPQSRLYKLTKRGINTYTYAIASSFQKMLYEAGVSEHSPELMKYIMHELLTDNTKMKAKLCTPQHTTQQAFESFIQARGIAK